MHTDIPCSIYATASGDGVEAHVFECSTERFALRVLDCDAGEWLPTTLFYADFEAARLYADLCAAGFASND
jgi:hypothetical protein